MKASEIKMMAAAGLVAGALAAGGCADTGAGSGTGSDSGGGDSGPCHTVKHGFAKGSLRCATKHDAYEAAKQVCSTHNYSPTEAAESFVPSQAEAAGNGCADANAGG